MQETSKALTPIPPRVQLAITPKPKRSEIIGALVRLRVAEIEKENDERLALRKQLMEEVTPEILALAKNEKAHVSYFGRRAETYTKGQRVVTNRVEGVTVTINLKKLPKSLNDKLAKIDALPTYKRVPNEKAIRREISDHLNGYEHADNRVSALLSSPAVRASLTSVLRRINKGQKS